MNIRGGGILLHISSLPSRFGIGDMGPSALKFADFLEETKQTYWQIIPLTPPNPHHYSPYHSPSAFAGNPLLISPESLVTMGLLKQSDVESPPSFPIELVDFPAVIQFKAELLRKAYTSFRGEHGGSSFDYSHFCEDNARWLDDYALFSAISEQFAGQTWGQWPKELRDRQYDALKKSSEELHDVIEMEKFTQFIFSKQWSALKNYCNRKGIQIIGDLPVYVDYNSAEVWAHPEFFKLDQDMRPYVVSGVPPDYFSATGQLWGHPIYNWDKLKETGYSWWLDRIEHNLNQCDILRIDHFRGFVGFWEVPAEEKTAINGKWVQGPADDFFKKVLRRFPGISIIAEDLGVITPDVRELIGELGVPGMKGPDVCVR